MATTKISPPQISPVPVSDPPRFLCVHLPRWSITRRRRKRPDWADQPLAVVHTVRQRLEIFDACPAAMQNAVRPGMTLAEARAMCPGLVSVDHDPAGDDRAIAALGRWMTRFTPVVATGWTDDGLPTTERHPRLLMLDITGCDRLFGSPAVIAKQVTSALNNMRVPSTVAVAPTPGAAWAFAVAGLSLSPSASPRRALPKGIASDGRNRFPPEVPSGPRLNENRTRLIEFPDLPAAAERLPVWALRLDPKTVGVLTQLGLNTVGRLLSLPRGTFEARFGRGLAVRLDQLLGVVAEPLVPLSYEVPVETRMEFESPIDSLETLWLVLAELVRRVTDDLQRRGHGARVVELLFTPDKYSGRPPVRKAVQLSTPTRNVNVLMRLLKSATEKLTATPASSSSSEPGGSAAGSSDRCDTGKKTPRRTRRALIVDGFVAVRLSVPLHEPVSIEQIPLLDDVAFTGRYELDRLVERLQVRLGDDAVVRPVLVESHLPEQRWQINGAASPPLAATPVAATPLAASQNQQTRFCEAAARPSPPKSSGGKIATRPLNLLPVPVEIKVIAEPDDDREGNPRQFTRDGRVHRLTHSIGPERIAGQWWRGGHNTRDYYDVQDDTGRRFWIFRVARLIDQEQVKIRWFMHGEFD